MSIKFNLRKYLHPVFIETGTYTGGGVQKALDAGFEQIHRSIDPCLRGEAALPIESRAVRLPKLPWERNGKGVAPCREAQRVAICAGGGSNRKAPNAMAPSTECEVPTIRLS